MNCSIILNDFCLKKISSDFLYDQTLFMLRKRLIKRSLRENEKMKTLKSLTQFPFAYLIH